MYANNLGAVDDIPQGMRDPDILAQHVKDLLLRHIPGEYVHVWAEGSGWSRRQLYSFHKPVPFVVVCTAMQKAGFAWTVTWLGGDS